MSTNGTNGSSANGTTPGNTWAGSARRGDGKIRVAIVGVGLVAAKRSGRETVHTLVPEAFERFVRREREVLGLGDGAPTTAGSAAS